MLLCDTDKLLSLPPIAEALGRSLTTVETVLFEWENGKLSYQQAEVGVKTSRDSTPFTSFFGRARTMIPRLLDLIGDDTIDEEEVGELPLLLTKKKSTLPLLKDLPLDPSTLCKLTCTFAELRRSHAPFRGGESLERVALRLMNSRSGRLLRECPMEDLVRLSHAVAMGSSSRERVGLFIRRLVQFLNEMPDGENPCTNLSPAEKATLLWSLGELGVKFHPKGDDEDSSSAHRRLQLVTPVPVVEHEQLSLLSDQSLIQMVSYHVRDTFSFV
jgi:hypothetical protein